MTPRALLKKVLRVQNIIAKEQKVAIAFSGGVDSSLLLAIAHETIPGRVWAITVSTPFVSKDETMQARKIARALGAKHIVMRVRLLQDRILILNERNRCYLCKRRIVSEVQTFARKHHATVMDASNYSDTKDFRPGLRALKELRILSPFIIARITKPEIRALAKQHGLAIWNKPANACLATRIPYGTRITPGALRRIDQAERYLHRLGFGLVRVRDHSGIARIEVAQAEIKYIIGLRRNITRRLHAIGFRYSVLDLEGYRTGSLH